MSDSWPSALALGAPLSVILVSGERVRGSAVAVEDEWLYLEAVGGRLAIARDAVAVLGLDGALPPSRGGGTGTTKRRGAVSSPAPNIPVADLRRAVDRFLDDADDASIAESLGLAKAQVGHLRRAFECARGNLVEDQLPGPARALVEPLRNALGG